jgi:methyl-accepting chemotaxis protein
MKTGKKLMAMIIAVNLAGAAILGGIVFQMSQRETEGQGIRKIIQQAEEKADNIRRHSAGLWPLMADIPRQTNRASVHHLLTAGAIIGGIMIVFVTAAAFIMSRRESGDRDPVQTPAPAPDKPEDKAGDIEQISMHINDLNREIEQRMKSILQSTAAIKQMLASMQTIIKIMNQVKDKTLLDGTQSETLDHITLTKQIQNEYRD